MVLWQYFKAVYVEISKIDLFYCNVSLWCNGFDFSNHTFYSTNVCISVTNKHVNIFVYYKIVLIFFHEN